jgi:hypothetical protein
MCERFGYVGFWVSKVNSFFIKCSYLDELLRNHQGQEISQMAMSESVKDALEWGAKALTVVVIPIGIYLVGLSIDLKLMGQELKGHQETIGKMEVTIDKIEGDLNQVQLNSQDLKNMRADLNVQNAMMREVYNWVLRQQGKEAIK